jgi:hypothetical protein
VPKPKGAKFWKLREFKRVRTPFSLIKKNYGRVRKKGEDCFGHLMIGA